MQHRFGQQLLELGVIRLQHPQALDVEHAHPAELLAPDVERGVAEAVLTAQVIRRGTRGRLFKEANNPSDCVSLLHVRPTPGDGLYLNQAGPANGASQIGFDRNVGSRSYGHGVKIVGLH